jgi:hypothetical protein
MSALTKVEVAQALKHPLRLQLLPIFIANRPLSPKDASRIIEAPLADVSYHVRVLVKFRFLVLNDKEQVRGAVKRYYLPNDEVVNSQIVKQFLAENP